MREVILAIYTRFEVQHHFEEEEVENRSREKKKNDLVNFFYNIKRNLKRLEKEIKPSPKYSSETSS